MKIVKGRETGIFVKKIEKRFIFELDQEELNDFKKFLEKTDGKGIPGVLTYIRYRFEAIIKSFKEED